VSGVEKLGGIFVGRCAGAQDEIIGGLLLRDAQRTRGEPDERVWPIERTGKMGQPANEIVVMANVPGFVPQGGQDARVAPRQRFGGEQQHGAEDAPSDRHAAFSREAKPHGALDLQFAQDGERHFLDLRIVQGGAPLLQTPQSPNAEQTVSKE